MIPPAKRMRWFAVRFTFSFTAFVADDIGDGMECILYVHTTKSCAHKHYNKALSTSLYVQYDLLRAWGNMMRDRKRDRSSRRKQPCALFINNVVP